MDEGEIYLRNVLDKSCWIYHFDKREAVFRSFVNGFFLIHEDKSIVEHFFNNDNKLFIETGIWLTLQDRFGYSFMDTVTLFKNIFPEYYNFYDIVPMEIALNWPDIYYPDKPADMLSKNKIDG